MTSRRALFNGARAARLLAMVAALRRNSGAATLVVAGSLLLPACSALAATRVNHPHHATTPSAGRVPAHVVRDEDVHASRSSGRSSTRKDHHLTESVRGETPERTSQTSRFSAAHKGAHASHNSRIDEPSRPASRPLARLQKDHKHHEPEPVGEPMPLRSADSHHTKHGFSRQTPREKDRASYSEVASRKSPTWNTQTNEPPHDSRRPFVTHATATAPVAEDLDSTNTLSAPVVLPMRNGTPGNVARNLARRAHQGHSAPTPPTIPASSEPVSQNPTGVSQPDDDERLLLSSAGQPPVDPASTRRQAATVAALARPTVSAPSTQPAQVNTAAVEGFGSEVDYRSVATQLTNRAAVMPVAPPHGTPAEQALSLREAAVVASKPMFVPLYNRDGKLVVPPPLKGSRDILIHQNQMADDAGLTRIQDDADLNRLRRAHLLIDIAQTASLHVNEALPENRRAARPWAVKFVNDMANDFYSHFGEALQVNSAVRTVAYQLRLQRVNGNAAAVDGEGASPHLTGQAIDIGKRGMSMAQIAWVRSYLRPLIDSGKIDVEEEFQQACFHISIYASYISAPHHHTPTRTELAQAPHVPRSQATSTEFNDNLQ